MTIYLLGNECHCSTTCFNKGELHIGAVWRYLSIEQAPMRVQASGDLHASPSAPATLEQRSQQQLPDTSLFSASGQGMAMRTLSGTFMTASAAFLSTSSPASTISGGSPPDWRTQNPGASPFGVLPAAAINAPEWVPAAAAQTTAASAPWVHGDHPFLAVRGSIHLCLHARLVVREVACKPFWIFKLWHAGCMHVACESFMCTPWRA